MTERLQALSAEQPRFGSLRLHALLVKEGRQINHKRVRRLCRQLHLQVPRCRRKRIKRTALSLTPVTRPNQRWGMDFVSDSLVDGRTIRALAIIDHYTRECLAIEVDFSLPGARVQRVLERFAAERGLPESIRVDNGPEFVCQFVQNWCKTKTELADIQPGKPRQNGHVESFNGKFRDECLNAERFGRLRHARQLIEAWRRDYNEQRPPSALDYWTPAAFAQAAKVLPAASCVGDTTADGSPQGCPPAAIAGLHPSRHAIVPALTGGRQEALPSTISGEIPVLFGLV